jgi:hypothetical protein
MAALARSPDRDHLPDIDNRAPSLVAWVGDGIDDGVRRLLSEVVWHDMNEQIVVEPLRHVFSGVEREHRWERTWKLVSHTGVRLRVSIAVLEGRDTVMLLRVGERDVTEVVPPWIEQRMLGIELPAEADREQRQMFYDDLLRRISVKVREDRMIDLRALRISSA